MVRTLNANKIPWIDAVASEDTLACEAMTAADLCVAAELESAIHSSRVAIDHDGQLPDLPEHSIVVYCAESTDNDLARILLDYLRRAYS